MTTQLNPDTLSGVVVSSMVTTPDNSTVRHGARVLTISPDVVDGALANMRGGTVTGIVFSGKMASGKDTIAERLSRRFDDLGLAPPVIHKTSDPIRAELNQATAIIKESADPQAAQAALVGQMDLPSFAAEEITRVLFETTRWTEPSAEERTNVNRYLLVYLADHGRRSVDPNYWVRICFNEMLTSMANGQSALLTGGRYPNEVFPAQVLGLLAVRIEVAHEVQVQRIRDRDGHEPDPELFYTENECALDDYVGFNLKVTNNALPEPTVAVVEQYTKEHAERLRA
jgi:hypothetical protein